jgi:hypothetical protein
MCERGAREQATNRTCAYCGRSAKTLRARLTPHRAGPGVRPWAVVKTRMAAAADSDLRWSFPSSPSCDEPKNLKWREGIRVVIRAPAMPQTAWLAPG